MSQVVILTELKNKRIIECSNHENYNLLDTIANATEDFPKKNCINQI